ncbi:MAG TPA: phosphoribosylformylglycinamidine synthase subunit PurL [Anaerolineaceae bacterium]|nr:phosphoribosylformylglycinamidine synthase subunit PurL [Anaerolineaceae bacterium]HPN53267.1 phosphoribosylformylglycinamidine synthase subunit PurL [Anaerolineaceae bacterium]
MTKISPEALIIRFTVRPLNAQDPRSRGCLADAHALGITSAQAIHCSDFYFIEGDLSEADLQRLAAELLCNPVTQRAEWKPAGAAPAPLPQGVSLVEVALRPGVTDPVAEELVRAAAVLGVAGVKRAASGQRYEIEGQVSPEELERLANRLLANPVIQRCAFHEITPLFPQEAQASDTVERLDLRSLDDAGLLALSQTRRAALDLQEMRAIQEYCRAENRDLTDVEFEAIAQTWSEHCVHKTFKARITIENHNALPPALQAKFPTPTINNIMKTYLKAATDAIAAPWVLSAFVDNAGIITYDGQNEVSFKVETHNHPSAVEPFGGANTGVGGVIRDVLGVSARPVAATDVLCFGPQDLDVDSLPKGVLHPRRILSGVVGGVQDYGNKIGIPTVSGGILYEEGFTANPLVFCGCLGIAPLNSHPRQIQPGDRVIVIGGRTGRDGLRGATFSSMTMDAQTGEVAGASVQIGNPITEKGTIEVVVRARDLGLYNAITDCGAGGFSSAIGEMSSTIGADVDLSSAPLKYPGLAPWEIWLSEAQERMVLAVPPQNLPALKDICAVYDVELTDLGQFEPTGRLVVRCGGRVVLNLENHFLHDGIPQRQLTARLSTRPPAEAALPEKLDAAKTLLALLAHPNIASKEAVIRIYDHEVQGGTTIKPLTGAEDDGPSDAAVLRLMGTRGTAAVVLSAGINPEYGKVDAGRMAHAVVDEAVRNAVAVGANPDRLAVLDNFCWGDPLRPETLGSLLEAARGCYEAALLHRTPFISGKDSLNNEYTGHDGQRHAIAPTLLISGIGVMEDLSLAVTMDLKKAGSRLYRVGFFDPALGGSHLNLVLGLTGGQAPAVAERTPQVYRRLHQAISQRLVRACHDLSEGGLAVAAAEMCIGGRLGLRLALPGGTDARLALFGETTGCLLVEVEPRLALAFEQLFAGLPLQYMGTVEAAPALTIEQEGRVLLNLGLPQLISAWNGKAWEA